MGTMTYDQAGNVIDEPSSYGGLSLPPAVPTSATPIPAQKSPAEIATRLAEWNKAFETMRSDSAINAGLLRIGTQLMQPIPVGQNAAGHAGQAVQAGFDTMNAKKTADLTMGMKMEEQSRAQRAAQLDEVKTADSLKTSAASRDRAAQRDPVELQQLQGNLQKLNDELALARAQEQAGLRTPEHLAKIADLELRGKEGKIALDAAHGRAFDSTASWNNSREGTAATAAAGKGGKQTLNVKEVDLQDGTKQIITTTMVNGKTFVTTVTLPKFGDQEQAQKQAEKDTSGKEPFFGTKGYTGTRTQEIERRTKELMTPRREIVESETGRRIDPKEYDAMGPETPASSQPTPRSAGEAAFRAQVPNETPNQRTAAWKEQINRFQIDQKEFMEMNDGKRSPEIDNEIRKAQREFAKREGTATTVPTESTTRIKMEPGKDGVYRPVGAAAPKPVASTPAAPIGPLPGVEIGRGGTARPGDTIIQSPQMAQIAYLKQVLANGTLTRLERARAMMTLAANPGSFTSEEVAKIRGN